MSFVCRSRHKKFNKFKEYSVLKKIKQTKKRCNLLKKFWKTRLLGEYLGFNRRMVIFATMIVIERSE